MKKSISLLTTLVLFTFFAACAQKSPKAKAEGINLKVNYGQPSKRGRIIFGELVPFGQVWRTGANEATEITFTKDAVFAGKSVKAGTYTLFTIPKKDKWTIILNTKLGEWGAFSYDKIKDKDILKEEVNTITLKEPVESLTLGFDTKGLTIAWDLTSVLVPISFI